MTTGQPERVLIGPRQIYSAAWKTDLPAPTKMVLLALAECVILSGLKVEAPVDRLVEMIGLSRAAVYEALAALELGRHITRYSQWRRPTVYLVHPSIPSTGGQKVDSTM